MKVNVYVPDQRIADVLESANSGYWAQVIDYPMDCLPLVTGGYTAILDEWGDESELVEEHKLTASKIKKGLRVLAEKYPHKFTEIVSEDYDQWTGDLLIQCALFGEEKYS